MVADGTACASWSGKDRAGEQNEADRRRGPARPSLAERPNQLCSPGDTASCSGLDRCLLCHASRSVRSAEKDMLTYKEFVNPTTETNGIVHVISRMKWYCELSILLLRENTVDLETSAGVRGELEQRVIDLYQALLLYLIKSVGSCYRNRFIAFLRDAIKLDDWNGSLQSVEAAENAVRQDSYAYTAQQISFRLDQLLDVAKNQESRLLQDIYGLLQQQLSVQMEKEDKECIQHLRLTDPRDDKMRIEETKGGLLEDSYHWILENSDFQRWRNDQQTRLLWIKGDPGKGKTMLLCGIVNELKKSIAKTDLLSYFFCQA